MTEPRSQEVVGEVIAGLLIVCAVLSFLALIVAITEPRPVINQVGLDNYDLLLAVDRCKPHNATFEQGLSCFQAVYGGKP